MQACISSMTNYMLFYVLSNNYVNIDVCSFTVFRTQFEYNYHLDLQMCHHFASIFLLGGYELIHPTSSESIQIHG